jgi:hypothetical protein
MKFKDDSDREAWIKFIAGAIAGAWNTGFSPFGASSLAAEMADHMLDELRKRNKKQP